MPRLTVPALARSAWHDFRRAWRSLVVFEVLFKLLVAWLLVPAAAVVLSALLSRADRVAVSNWDLLDFLLSPIGILSLALFGTAAVALLLVEQAAIMLLVALSGSGERPALGPALHAALRKTWGVARLGAIKFVLLALTFVPFVLLAALTYGVLLTGHDVYFYVTARPPVFWVAAGIGGLLLAAFSAVGAFLFVRWAFALPILLFEAAPARSALLASRERVHGVAWRVGGVLLGWQLGCLLLGAAAESGFRLAAGAALANAGPVPVARILLLLLAKGAIYAALSFVTVVGQALLTRRLYLARNEQLGLACPERLELAAGPEQRDSPWIRWLAYGAVALVVLAPLAVWADLPWYQGSRPLVRITAHRGHSRAAPENTLSAIRKAIESGADYAEVDLQLTADGAIVLLHDTDLRRVAGLSRRIDALSLAEVRELDVGSWFHPSFSAERVPTLQEAIELARGRIKLNLELKSPGLAREVGRLIEAKGFEAECLVTSFRYDDLQDVKRHNPGARTGLIVARALGDVSQLNVDAVNVRADRLTDDVLREAQRNGMEVHVWTLNDPARLMRFMKRGVDNVLTSDPDLASRVRDEWARLTEAERLLLASRLLLGLDPPVTEHPDDFGDSPSQ